MDLNTKKQCAAQLQGLAKKLVESDDVAAETQILEICSALVALVDANPQVSTLEDSVFQERLFSHEMLYSFMDKFMSAASNMVDIPTIQGSLMKGREEYNKKCTEKKALEEERDQCNLEIQNKEAEIRSIYSAREGLIRKVEEQEKKLVELKKKQVEYTPEKLNDLTAQVEILEVNTKDLQERYYKLNKQTAETLGDLSAVLEKIGELSAIHSKETEETIKKTKEFKTAIEVLCKTNEEYQSWFKGIASPLEALGKLVGKEEAQKLQGVMSQDELKNKNDLVKQIEQDLKRLDQLARVCARAAGQDYKTIIDASER